MAQAEDLWQYRAYIRNLVRQSGQVTEIEDDIVQDVFVRALQGLRLFEDRCALATWLFDVTRSVVVDRQRRLGADMRRAETVSLDEAYDDSDETLRSIDSFLACDPWRAVYVDLLVEDILKQLPAKHTKVLADRYLKELSREELVELYDIRYSGVDTRIRRAMEYAREVWK